MKDKILAINPGSTSTKIAYFQGNVELWHESIDHDEAALKGFERIYDQLDYRYDLVVERAQAHGAVFAELAAVVARGGILPPVPSGALTVNDAMLHTLEDHPVRDHASNLGAGIARRIAQPLGIPALVYDPVSVDELVPVARITGLKELRRRGQAHNLNMRAAAMRVCREKGLNYHDANIVVAHLGGGTSASLHVSGRIIDMISDDEEGFSPQRVGALPLHFFLDLVFSKGLDHAGAYRLLKGGGVQSHLGTSDMRIARDMAANGDDYARLVLDAFALGMARNVARLSVLVDGNVDHIVLTGGVAHSPETTEAIAKRVRFIAPVTVYPGEDEMQALCDGALRVLNGEEQAMEYADDMRDTRLPFER